VQDILLHKDLYKHIYYCLSFYKKKGPCLVVKALHYFILICKCKNKTKRKNKIKLLFCQKSPCNVILCTYLVNKSFIIIIKKYIFMNKN